MEGLRSECADNMRNMVVFQLLVCIVVFVFLFFFVFVFCFVVVFFCFFFLFFFFFISQRSGFSFQVLHRCSSNEYLNLYFCGAIRNISRMFA